MTHYVYRLTGCANPIDNGKLILIDAAGKKKADAAANATAKLYGRSVKAIFVKKETP